jgi:bis(5'-nucleosyl)-tetraphosphatase (symmetrical)
MHLLDAIRFDSDQDVLWFTGDLVNRGPKSLDVLRFVKSLGKRAVTVLGNHDLHLLAASFDATEIRRKDTFDDILNAPDRDDLIEWLRHQPLMHFDSHLEIYMIHAGLPPQWSAAKATDCAREVEKRLAGDHYVDFLQEMYGDRPDQWSDLLAGPDRLRFITNCFTRLRYCSIEGRLALDAKGVPGSQPAGYLPWFAVPGRASAGMKILFGHWSTLGFTRQHGICALDTGCLWGGRLTALKLSAGSLETMQATSVRCSGARTPGED